MRDKNGEAMVVMANSVAEARHSLSVPEQRLILWLVSRIERDEDVFREHTAFIQDLEQIMGSEANNGRIYQQMEAVCTRLQERVLEIQEGDGSTRIKFNWLHSSIYHNGEGRITMRFHELLAPLLLQLKERFCQIPLRELFLLRGGYAIRWLEKLHARKYLGGWQMTVEELRDWLHVGEGELKTRQHLRDRAIDVPRRELDEKSSLSFTYKPYKSGKKIIGWHFKIKENKKTSNPIKARRASDTKPVKSAYDTLLEEHTRRYYEQESLPFMEKMAPTSAPHSPSQPNKADQEDDL